MSLMFAIPRKSIISFFFKQYKTHDSHSLGTKVQGNQKGVGGARSSLCE